MTADWDNDQIQFMRLLAEIVATQENLDMDALAAEMDLEVEDVVALFDRAQETWANHLAAARVLGHYRITEFPVVDGITLRTWRYADADVYEDVLDDTDGFLGEIEGAVPVGDANIINGTFLYLRVAVVREGDDTPIGLVQAGGTNEVTMDLSLIDSVKGQGVGRAVVRAVNRLVREHLPGIPVVGVISEDNERCLAMAHSLGIDVERDGADHGYYRATRKETPVA